MATNWNRAAEVGNHLADIIEAETGLHYAHLSAERLKELHAHNKNIGAISSSTSWAVVERGDDPVIRFSIDLHWTMYEQMRGGN